MVVNLQPFVSERDKYSDFLVAMISVGLALARPNNITLVSQMVTNRSTFQSMLFLRFLNVYNYTSFLHLICQKLVTKQST